MEIENNAWAKNFNTNLKQNKNNKSPTSSQ